MANGAKESPIFFVDKNILEAGLLWDIRLCVVGGV
jgi:hypothetical protein